MTRDEYLSRRKILEDKHEDLRRVALKTMCDEDWGASQVVYDEINSLHDTWKSSDESRLLSKRTALDWIDP